MQNNINKNELDILSVNSDYLVFLDETGDPKFHKDISIYDSPTVFPVSTVLALIIKKDTYKSITIPKMLELKNKYFNNLNIVLHSNDIRNKNGVFKVLLDNKVYSDFKKDIVTLFKESQVKIVSSSINKIKLLNKNNDYASQNVSYDLGGDLYIKNIEWVCERVGHFAMDKKCSLIFETQGPKESRKIKALLSDLIKNGSFYTNKERYDNIDNNILFFRKNDEVTGIELADYCAYPFSRHAKDKNDKNNMLFGILKEFVYEGDFGKYGLKEWP